MSKQKFPIGSKVKVVKDLPRYMFHFPSDFEAIVKGTYKQLCGVGKSGYKDYSLIMLDDRGKPVDSLAWYEEDQLTLVSDDTKAGKKIIKKFKQ